MEVAYRETFPAQSARNLRWDWLIVAVAPGAPAVLVTRSAFFLLTYANFAEASPPPLSRPPTLPALSPPLVPPQQALPLALSAFWDRHQHSRLARGARRTRQPRQLTGEHKHETETSRAAHDGFQSVVVVVVVRGRKMPGFALASRLAQVGRRIHST